MKHMTVHAIRLPFVSALILAAALPSTARAERSLPATPQAVREFRANFGAFLDTYDSIYATLQRKSGNLRVGAGRLRMQGVSDEALVKAFALHGGVPDFSGALAAAQNLLSITTMAQLKSPLRQGAVSLASSSPDGYPETDPLFNKCDSLKPGSIQHDSAFTFGALEAVEITRDIYAAANHVCEETILGENASLVCIPFEIAAALSADVFDLATFCSGEQNQFDTLTRLQFLHDMINAVVYGDSGAAPVSAAPTATAFTRPSLFTRISQAQNSIETLQFRLAIESALSTDSRQAFLILPQGSGGNLELVRQIAATTIANAKTAGVDVRSATRDLAEGDEAFARGRYGRAYNGYRSAFREATPGDDDEGNRH